MALNNVTANTPPNLGFVKLNENDKINQGRASRGLFNKNELDDLYTKFSPRKYAREVALGNATSSYTNWSHVEANDGYSVWKYPVSGVVASTTNEMYNNDVVLSYQGVASSESTMIGFNSVQTSNSKRAGATFTNHTTEAASTSGTPFSLVSYTVVTNEVVSAVHGGATIQLDYENIIDGSVVLSTQGLSTYYSETTDFTMTYGSGLINTLSAGSIASGDQLYISYEVGNTIYVGSGTTFANLNIDFATKGVGNQLQFAYSSGGSNWTDFNPTLDSTNNFSNDGNVTWTAGDLTNWATTTVNASASLYWVRVRVTQYGMIYPTCYHLVRADAAATKLVTMAQTDIADTNWKWAIFSNNVYVAIQNAGTTNNEGVKYIKSSSDNTKKQNYFVTNNEYILNNQITQSAGLTIHDSVVVSGDLTVGGDFVISGAIIMSGNLGITGDLTASGIITNNTITLSGAHLYGADWLAADTYITINNSTPGTLESIGLSGNILHITSATTANLVAEGDSGAHLYLSDSNATSDQRIFKLSSDTQAFTLTSLQDDGTLIATPISVTSAGALTLDFGTNTQYDENMTGNWDFNSGNLSNIGTLGCGAITSVGNSTFTSADDTRFDITDSGDSSTLRLRADASLSIYAVTAHPINIYSNSVNQLWVDNTNQRVGINTNSPSYTLDINGTLKADSATFAGALSGITTLGLGGDMINSVSDSGNLDCTLQNTHATGGSRYILQTNSGAANSQWKLNGTTTTIQASGGDIILSADDGSTAAITIANSNASSTFAGDIVMGAGAVIDVTGGEIIQGDSSIDIDIDADNDSTTRIFRVMHNGRTAELLRVQEDGLTKVTGTLETTGTVGIGGAATAGLLHVIDTTGAGVEIQETGNENLYVRINRYAADRRGEIDFETGGVQKWAIGMADSNDLADGTQFFIGTALGGAAATNGIIIDTAYTVTIGAGGLVFPTSDPNIAGAWWDNAGTLTKSAG